MDIKLELIEEQKGLSKHSTAYIALLKINGIKAACVRNYGKGEPTQIYVATKENDDLVRQADAFCRKLPPFQDEKNFPGVSIPYTLDFYVDKLVATYLDQRPIQSVEDDLRTKMERGIVFGTRALYNDLPLGQSLNNLLKTGKGRDLVKFGIEEVQKILTPGHQILNTNIPASLLSEIKQPVIKIKFKQTPKNIRHGPSKNRLGL